MKKQKTYISKNNKPIVIDLNNDQQHDRPFKYICVDADLISDIAETQNIAEIKVVDAFNFVMNLGLKAIGLNSADYNFSRKMKTNIRNIGIHPQQQAEYDLLMNKSMVPVAAVAPVAANNINPLNNWITKQFKIGMTETDIINQLLVKKWTIEQLTATNQFKSLNVSIAPPPPPPPTATAPSQYF